jgi:hypothetical protein
VAVATEVVVMAGGMIKWESGFLVVLCVDMVNRERGERNCGGNCGGEIGLVDGQQPPWIL